MFISVKNLTTLIDNTLKFLEEGKASKEKFEENVYNTWYINITNNLNAQLKKLKQISSNNKLIEKYERKIQHSLSN